MTFPSIRLEGAILSPDVLDALAGDAKHGQRAADFGLDPTASVRSEILDTWSAAKTFWRSYRSRLDALRPGATGTSETRNIFISPLLSLLGYSPALSEAETVNGKPYAISHRGTARDGFPIHIIGPSSGEDTPGVDRSTLDIKIKGVSRMSPHALVQEYLNLTEHLYALVTNGFKIRLLRDSSRLVKLSFLEFDFERMFEEELTADFALLYRLLHATRMPANRDEVADCIIERYHQDALDSGSRIRDGLATAVEACILDLANGFLAHPVNDELRKAAATDTFATERGFPKPFYGALLRLIYRFLFLLVTEERGLVQPRTTDRRKIKIYQDCYSLTRLRALAESVRFHDKRHTDAWQSLLRCFALFEPGNKGAPLDIRPLGGLFDHDAIGLLVHCQLDNRTLLRCLRKLSLFQNPTNRQWMRINYAALNVEEFGSVYEGLLEYDPQITEPSHGEWQFRFKAGDARASSGSHYTPDELVQPLIKHSLDHLIADRLKDPDPKKALLSLTVCDVACGSGHILLSAARRIGTELAILRTGEDQPSPAALREAVRDVIRNCIYGVDFNPLAVELCKVALWLEAHVPGEPLGFLDHRIKCGNAVVGLARQEELRRGIPDQAFKTLPDDNKEFAALLRKRNKDERKGHQELPWGESRQADITALEAELADISALPENTPEDIHYKQERYDAYRHSQHLRNLWTLADLPVAQFYLPKTEKERNKITTHDRYRKYLGGESFDPEKADGARAIAKRKRFFHWFLEFPIVFEKGGFDLILGNPPFLGDKKITPTYGESFFNWVMFEFAPTPSIDLVGYFFRRIFTILSNTGFQALISTNTIAQGKTRKGALEQIRNHGGELVFAAPSQSWPGRAAVTVSLTSIHKGKWTKERFLGTRPVTTINTFLDDSESLGDPFKLNASTGISFQGSTLMGKGFVVSHEVADELQADHKAGPRIIFPYLTGFDLYNRVDQSASRRAINFFDWTEAKSQEVSARALDHLRSTVKVERDSKSNVAAQESWWLHWRARPDLYQSIEDLDYVIARARVSKTHAFALVPADQVFADVVVVFANRSWALFSTLQSSLHEVWAWKYCSTMKGDLRYSPTDCFENFPVESALTDAASLGEPYHEHRRSLMQLMQLGLTKTYNLFHTRELTKAAVAKASKQMPEVAAQAYQDLLALRDLHRQMDEAVLAAYGWHEDTDDWGPAIALRHDFYEVDYLPENDRVRYTIHPDARKELLKRLLKLNHQRHAEEEAASPHGKKPKQKATRKRKSDSDPAQPELLSVPANEDHPTADEPPA